jgi:hypothetical protein
MTNDRDAPVAPPPLASWWGRTGLLYVGLSVLGAMAGSAAAMLLWDRATRQATPSVSEYVMNNIHATSFNGAAVAVAQWLVLRRLVRRALRAASCRDLSQPERRLVRDTALWIVATIAGTVTSGAFGGLIFGILLHSGAHGLLGLPTSLFNGLISGLILGTAQWLVLRRQVPSAGRWIRWTVGGLMLGNIAYYIVWSLLTLPFEQANPNPWMLWAIHAPPVAAFVSSYAFLQSACLKRLAPGWLTRHLETTRETMGTGGVG